MSSNNKGFTIDKLQKYKKINALLENYEIRQIKPSKSILQKIYTLPKHIYIANSYDILLDLQDIEYDNGLVDRMKHNIEMLEISKE